MKNRKKPFRKSIEKKDEKKRGEATSQGCGSAAIAQPRESKDSAQEGSCQVRNTDLKHASTPGGVRRITWQRHFPPTPHIPRNRE